MRTSIVLSPSQTSANFRGIPAVLCDPAEVANCWNSPCRAGAAYDNHVLAGGFQDVPPRCRAIARSTAVSISGLSSRRAPCGGGSAGIFLVASCCAIRSAITDSRSAAAISARCALISAAVLSFGFARLRASPANLAFSASLAMAMYPPITPLPCRSAAATISVSGLREAGSARPPTCPSTGPRRDGRSAGGSWLAPELPTSGRDRWRDGRVFVGALPSISVNTK
jgi:hypothetical protein